MLLFLPSSLVEITCEDRCLPQEAILVLSDGVRGSFTEHLQCGLGSPWVLFLALLLLSCVTLGKCLNFSEPQFFHL